MKVIVWKFKGIEVTILRVPQIEVSLQLQFPASFDENTVTENNYSGVLRKYSYSNELFSHCKCSDSKRNGLLCLFWGAFVGSSPVLLPGSLF